jgi:hypothetical protein
MNSLIMPPSIKGIGLSTLAKRKPQTLLAAIQHNRRDPEGRGWRNKSDPRQIHLNQRLTGPDSTVDVVLLQGALMDSVGHTPRRKDYSQGFEVLFTTPPDFTVSYDAYFSWCLDWTRANVGDGGVLSADSHFDEGEPHLHILMVPITDGQWIGNAFATPKTWPGLQAKFGRDLELMFGLKTAPQLKGKALTAASTTVKAGLIELLAPHIAGDVLDEILKLAGRKPAGLLRVMKLNQVNGDGGEAFKRIALSAGKGSKKNAGRSHMGSKQSHMGLKLTPKKANPFLCMGSKQHSHQKQHRQRLSWNKCHSSN